MHTKTKRGPIVVSLSAVLYLSAVNAAAIPPSKVQPAVGAIHDGMVEARALQLTPTTRLISNDVTASPGVFFNTGSDECPLATVVPVPVGPAGSPSTVTIFSDNSSASGSDCQSPADVGWWEAFQIDTCATVTIDHCGTTPIQRPDWLSVYSGCGCFHRIEGDFFDRGVSCGELNISMTYLTLAPGTYYYPVYTVPGDKRCGNSGAACVSTAECAPGFVCTDNLHPYVMHISAEAAAPSESGQVASASVALNEEVAVPAGVPTTGPDLIVGHVFGCTELGREGPVGSGTIGMSCWTTACTVGDEGTNWWGLPSVDHPMINVNLFRLSTQGGADRLMQLGQSWLKHGFGTENADDCAFGCTPGHFNLNGPGCSDTYAASQFLECDLGPKSMINPYTGVMPADADLGPSPGCSPFSRETTSVPANDHRDHVHNQISHRLQVLDVDLDLGLNPGAEYYAEGQYIVPHEFVGGNGTQNNNASYRKVGVMGNAACGGLFFVELSDTFQQQPALNAWAGASQTLIEPAPLVDGRGFLAHKVTDLGGGMWHYEYALYNMNMDRAMRSLSIPLPNSTAVSDIGFYAPLNHAPEPHTDNYLNTPWTVSTAGGAVTWSTDTFGADPMANAVRFATMYNFWFNADAPPVARNATVGLFKTGGSVLAATVGPDENALPPPNIVWNPDPSSSARGTRSLTISTAAAATATGGPTSSAIRVELVDLQNPSPANPPCCPAPNFGTYESESCTAGGEGNGCVRWAGPPVTVRESQDNLALGTFTAARLQCTPYYTDWTALGSVHIVGPEIMPSSTFEMNAYGSSCKGVEGSCANVSTPVQAQTRRSGDVSSPYAPSGTQPDPQDVVAVLNKFKNQPGAPGKAIAQIQPNVIELNNDVGALDIVAVIDAFRGVAYPYSGPCPCPSTIICGANSCGVCAGGGLCVRTCSGGSNAGQPCLNDNHCPGGTCPASGFCRDRCGRCQ